MAVRTSSPWWLSAIFLVGLVLIFAGQRALAHMGGLATTLSVLGLAVVLAVTGLRTWAVLSSRGEMRRAEGLALLQNLGVLIALGIYAATQPESLEVLGLAPETESGASSLAGAATAVWMIILGISVIPEIFVQVGLGFAGRSRFARGAQGGPGAPAVEMRRVSELATSGLTIALAASFLMVTCHVVSEHNVRKDVSYFKTSSPGSATVNMVGSVSEPIRVLLFFPEVNRVKEEVRGYFEALNRDTDNLTIEEHDRMVSAELAREHQVKKDGTIVLLRGDQSERIQVASEFRDARAKDLRNFDGKVQKAVMKVIRDKRVAYFTVGHGELNDPESAAATGTGLPRLSANLLRRRLRSLNYQVKDLGLSQGLAQRVPDDATIVFVLMPRTALLPEELESLKRYLENDGSMFVALDPEGDASLGPLSGALGVNFVDTPLADDREFVVRRRNKSDHRLILTNQFSSHASITTLARGSARSGILLITSGYLEDAPFDISGKPERTYVVNTMKSAFTDVNDNHVFDEGSEKRDRYNIGAAVERKPAKAKDGGDTGGASDGKNSDGERGMRAMVFADGEIFSDALLSQVPMLQALADDSIKWLGGEEEFSGQTESEEDVRIEHTKSEDVIWFYSTIVGAPVLVLGLGLSWVFWRRRRLYRRA